MEKWLRKEIEIERKKRKERIALGLPEFEEIVEGSRVSGAIGNNYSSQLLNNGWGGGRLNSTLAGEKAFELSSNRVLR